MKRIAPSLWNISVREYHWIERINHMLNNKFTTLILRCQKKIGATWQISVSSAEQTTKIGNLETLNQK